jgi:hypothetical protein
MTPRTAESILCGLAFLGFVAGAVVYCWKFERRGK